MPLQEQSTHSREQAIAALAIANRVRVENGRMLEALGQHRYADGLDAAAKIVRNGDMKGPVGTIRLGRLVTSVKYCSDMKARGIFSRAGLLDPSRRLSSLTPRQREVLAESIEDAAFYSRDRARRHR